MSREVARHVQSLASAEPSDKSVEKNRDCFSLKIVGTHINTTKVFLFDTGVGQEGVDQGNIH